MSSALIGYTGFVGGALMQQQSFADTFNRSNIDSISGRGFDTVVCAGVPAAKWIANRDPEKDRENIHWLMRVLDGVDAGHFVLISTVDVYPVPIGVDESTAIDPAQCQPYGRHRYELEQFVRNRFDACVIRLPGLFGHGLKKNVIYDFLNNNNVDQIDSRGVFQFYSLQHLTRDIEKARGDGIELLNITSEPTSVGEVARVCLGHDFVNELDRPVARYDYRSRHAALFGGNDGYLYSKDQVLGDLASYVSETRKKQAG